MAHKADVLAMAVRTIQARSVLCHMVEVEVVFR